MMEMSRSEVNDGMLLTSPNDQSELVRRARRRRRSEAMWPSLRTGVSMNELAEDFGVSLGAIQHIIKRDTWRDI